MDAKEAVKVVSVILGGGQGSRLWPLTRDRSKPAVPIAGKYRLVDIPISNCIRSGLNEIYLLTQFNSVSLHEHVSNTYKFDPFHRGFVRILAAQQTPDSSAWYQGTADAVRKSFNYFMDTSPDLIVILSGDQLYRLNLGSIIDEHLEKGADVTICTKPVCREDVGMLGLMEVDSDSRISNFVEKPEGGEGLSSLQAPMYQEERYLASMGIYIFNTLVLRALLENDLEDFGRDIIPSAIRKYFVYSSIYEGFWRDIGTVRSFWEANLGLADPVSEFTLYDANSLIFTHMRYLPPVKINRCALVNSLVSEGCILSGELIKHSVIGIRSMIGAGSVVEDAVVMGADYYEMQAPSRQVVPLGIGERCVIRNAIIDKNARIGDGCVITPDGKVDGTDTDLYSVRDGIIVVPKNTVILSGTTI